MKRVYISDWDGEGDPPLDIYPPVATNRTVKGARAQYVYISRTTPMSMGGLKETNIFWGESIIYREDIIGCDLIYERDKVGDFYLLKKILMKSVSENRKKFLNLINDYRKKFFMKDLMDNDWTDDDLEKECKRLGLS